MRCPSCGSLDTQVKDSRPTEDSAVIRRRRVCLTCNFRFTTFERVQLRELTVIKRNGRRVPFDRDKLMRSVQIALRKRSVDPERIEKMVSKIVRELESGGENEVSSEAIGEIVMEHLREIDDVAYVRFASVYRNFGEVKDFRAALDELSGDDGRGAARCAAAQMNDTATPVQRTRQPTTHVTCSWRLALGRRGLGNAWPNPAVGAVIVKDGVIVGRGWTQPGGRPHAEVEALRRAKKDAKGATLYATLEPCSHNGKSPPCADAIIKAGIARVVSALEDPNPEVAGPGPCAPARQRHRCRCRSVRRRSARDMPATSRASEKAPACDAQAGDFRRRQSGPCRPQAGCDYRRSRAQSRVSDARAERRHSGRHRHRAVRQSATDRAAARPVRAFAGARRARCAIARAGVADGDLDRARYADLGVHLEQGLADGRGHSCSRRAARCFVSTIRKAGSISTRC